MSSSASSSGSVDKKAAKNQWVSIFQEAHNLDRTGSTLAAAESYLKLVVIMKNRKSRGNWLVNDLNFMHQLMQCLTLRANHLKQKPYAPEFSLEQMQEVQQAFDKLFTDAQFPINMDRYVIERSPSENAAVLSSHPRMRFFIDKIGFQDPEEYQDPVIEVSIWDDNGNNIEPIQSTPISSKRHGRYIDFDNHIIEFPILPRDLDPRSLGKQGIVIFEFAHFKPSKKKNSVRCWSFLDHDEIKDGVMALDLYSKPIDYKRKNLKPLYPNSTLYLHIKIEVAMGSE